MNYRAEMDGLRAIAVVPVILFHAGFDLFSGGFVGVDVFFVISGYFITTSLIQDIESKRFSIFDFYERRARRILPALFFVMIVCIPFAWGWMVPSQIKDFSQSLVAVSLFVSNILIWRESGYFDDAAEGKPLLHTWSLAVEEQYYVLFPIFLVLAWRFGKNRVFWMIVLMAAISLMLSEWGWRNRAAANFYLAPTRAWELFAGSIAAFVVQKKGVQKSNLLALIGVAAVIFSIFAYDESTPFPSLYTLMPVLGVMLIVLYAKKETLVAKLLSAKFFVGIGVISYSAYLWHQPVFAFSRLKVGEQNSSLLMLMLSAISVALAYFTWKYIEKPFRNKNSLSRNFILNFSVIGILTFVVFGFSAQKLMLYAYGPVMAQNELSEDASQYVWKRKNELRKVRFSNNMRKILLVGDSNSGDLINAMEYIIDENKVSVSSLRIDLGCGNVYVDADMYKKYIQPSRVEVCRDADSLFSEISQELIDDADVVIFASSWLEWQVPFLAESRRRLVEEFGEKFWWFGNKHLVFPGERERVKINGNLAEFYPPNLTKQAINDSMQKILEDRFVDPYKILCFDQKCRVKDEEEGILIYDGFHLSRNGAEYLAREISRVMPFTVQSWLGGE